MYSWVPQDVPPKLTLYPPFLTRLAWVFVPPPSFHLVRVTSSFELYPPPENRLARVLVPPGGTSRGTQLYAPSSPVNIVGTPADRPLLHATHIFICLVCWSLTGTCFSCLCFLTRLHMCLKMSHFFLHLRFASSPIPVWATYNLELRLPWDTRIARG